MKSDIIQKLDKESSPIFDKVAAKMRTAARIADAMKAVGLSKSQFARKMGKSPSEITKWLSGTHNFTIDSLQEISAVLGVEGAIGEVPGAAGAGVLFSGDGLRADLARQIEDAGVESVLVFSAFGAGLLSAAAVVEW